MQFTSETKDPTRRYLIAALLASASASICCIGPLFLLATGISGAWMSRLMIMEPFQPILIAVTIAFFALAGWKIFLAGKTQASGPGCTVSAVSRRQKLTFSLAGIVALVLLTSEYWILLLAA